MTKAHCNKNVALSPSPLIICQAICLIVKLFLIWFLKQDLGRLAPGSFFHMNGCSVCTCCLCTMFMPVEGHKIHWNWTDSSGPPCGCWRANWVFCKNKYSLMLSHLSSPKLLTLLPQLPRCWDYRYMPPYLHAFIGKLFPPPITKTRMFQKSETTSTLSQKVLNSLCYPHSQSPERPAELKGHVAASSFACSSRDLHSWHSGGGTSVASGHGVEKYIFLRFYKPENLFLPTWLTENLSIDLFVGLE